MKSRPNKLSPFAERLDDMEAEGKTLAQMQEALRLDGCQVSISYLGEFLVRRREEKQQRELLRCIATGGQMSRELDAAFVENPAPDVDRLIQVTKTLVMSLQVQGTANPDMLKLANSMQQTVLNYLSGKTRAEIEMRKLTLGEAKYRDEVAERKRLMQAELDKAKSSGGITPETLEKIEKELKLL